MLNQFNQSLWGDEAFSAILSMKSIPDIIKIISRDTSPPLYNITEHLWFQLFGISEVAIRALSFFYYLVAAFFVFKIAQFLWNKKTAAIALGLILLNPFLFSYAFEGRMYSLLAMTVTASFYFFIVKSWPAYIAATTLALYTHHFAIFAVLIQGFWFLKEFLSGNKKVAMSILKSFVVIAILYSPWLIPLYGQVKMVGGGFWLGRPDYLELKKLIYKYLAEGIEHNLARLALYLAFIVLILRNWTKDIEKSLFLLLWFLGPILLTWVISQKFSPIFFDRYLLYAIPAAILIIASNTRKISFIFLIPLAIIFIIIDTFYFTHPAKIPFRDLANYVKSSEVKGDFLINEDVGNHKLWESKYYGIPAPIYNPANSSLPYFIGTALMENGDVINTLPKNINRLGVITYKSGKSLETELKGFKTQEEKDFGSLKFVWMITK